MDSGFEQEIELTRRDQGNLAEVLVAGLNEDLPSFVEKYISSDAENRYPEYTSDRSVDVYQSDLNEYTWTEAERVDVDPNLSWRPDVIAKAKIIFHSGDRGLEVAATRLTDLEVPDPPVFKSRKWGYVFEVFYPIEVKSGEKVTLTEQQAEAIPEVAENSPHVHPLVAEVDISELPDSFEVVIRNFEDSSFSGESRY